VNLVVTLSQMGEGVTYGLYIHSDSFVCIVGSMTLQLLCSVLLPLRMKVRAVVQVLCVSLDSPSRQRLVPGAPPRGGLNWPLRARVTGFGFGLAWPI
jgi:hypothetical protein